VLQVQLVEYPVRVGLRARQHRESVLREFAIIASHGGEAADVPKRLVEISLHSDEIYADSTRSSEDAIDAAHARGEEHLTLEFAVPERFEVDARDTTSVLVEVYEYCTTGDLLTLTPPDDIKLYWIWLMGEFVRQTNGLGPISWREYADRFLGDAGTP
jgi:hypothetical protein